MYMLLSVSTRFPFADADIPDVGPRELKQLKGFLHKPPHKRRFRSDGAPRHPIPYIIAEGWLPALYFAFSRRDCEKLCERQARMSDLLTKEERRYVLAAFDDLARRYEVDKQPGTNYLRDMAMRGSLYHHAGLLPIYKEIVERLFTDGHVKLLFTTETFALGINMPARSVGFESLRKFDGVKLDLMRTRNFRQMAGRAGRRGIDDHGFVYANVNPEEDRPRG